MLDDMYTFASQKPSTVRTCCWVLYFANNCSITAFAQTFKRKLNGFPISNNRLAFTSNSRRIACAYLLSHSANFLTSYWRRIYMSSLITDSPLLFPSPHRDSTYNKVRNLPRFVETQGPLHAHIAQFWCFVVSFRSDQSCDCYLVYLRLQSSALAVLLLLYLSLSLWSLSLFLLLS